MDKILNLFKKKSETPLQTIERFVALHPEWKNTRMTYAGRLDPMAEGVLIVPTGEKNKQRDAYTALDKDYEFEFMLGVETDTFDLLGKITSAKGAGSHTDEAVKNALQKYAGKFYQKYPSYSSKIVDGMPLFVLARRGMLRERDIPRHEVVAQKIEFLSKREMTKDTFVETLFKDISALVGDFRQKDILETWNRYFAEKAPASFTIYKARVSCGSGFYVRQLVSDIGHDLGQGAVTVSILRTRVGEYRLEDSVK